MKSLDDIIDECRQVKEIAIPEVPKNRAERRKQMKGKIVQITPSPSTESDTFDAINYAISGRRAGKATALKQLADLYGGWWMPNSPTPTADDSMGLTEYEYKKQAEEYSSQSKLYEKPPVKEEKPYAYDPDYDDPQDKC